MTAAFFLFEDVDFGVELGVRSQATWLHNNLTTLDLLALNTAKQKTCVVTSLTLVEVLFEGLDAGNNRVLSSFDTNDFNWVVDLDNTLLNTASSNSTTTLD